MIRKKNTKKKTKRKKRIIISVQIDKINDKLISVFVWTNVFFFSHSMKLINLQKNTFTWSMPSQHT